MLALLLVSISLLFPLVQVPASNTKFQLKTAIARENAQQGTLNWQIPPRYAATTQIQAYASTTSVRTGQTITFYVSTETENTRYFIDIYRLGWYGGLGGRLMEVVTNLAGRVQGYYDRSTHRLVDCKTCTIVSSVGLLKAHWLPSYTLIIPTNWTSGVYIAKFVDAHALQTYATFDVKSNLPTTYIIVTSELTFQAYNAWGGYSLYGADDLQNHKSETPDLARALKVSFDRPYLDNNGSGQVFLFEINAIHWLESQGYDLSYISDIDLHEHPKQILAHRAYIDLGHDEYWTKEMRDGIENARDHGVGLAFLGANTSYWQVRLEPDGINEPDRTVVCYRVSSLQHTLANDPFYRRDNSRLTALWRDPILHRPEDALVGIMYSGFTHTIENFSWQLASHTNSPLLAGTNLEFGQKYGCNIVGYEWDRVFANGSSPPGLQILGSSPTINYLGKHDISNTTYYIAHSGALVFAAGSIYLTRAIDAYRYLPDTDCPQQSILITGMQTLLSNVMAALIMHHKSNTLADAFF